MLVTPKNGSLAEPPLPEGGWSHSVVRLENALVVPPTTSGLVQECGVFAKDGTYCHEAVTWRLGRPCLVEPAIRPAATRRLDGRYLYAGQIWRHFGHFLVESLSRIWALGQLDGALDGIVFMTKRPGKSKPPENFRKQILDLFGINVPILVLDEPTEVAHLIVPGQGFGLGSIAEGTQPFRDFLRSDFAPDLDGKGPERIYLSRSELGPTEGSILLEKLLEQNLSTNGYVTIHPQQLSIKKQIKIMRAATHVIGPDSSAFHMLGLAAKNEKKVAVIRRRSTKIYHSIIWQVTGATGRQPTVIDALERDWHFEDARRAAGRNSWGQLDFKNTAEQLMAAGMIDDFDKWEMPRWRQKIKAAESVGQASGKPMKYKKAKADPTFRDDPAISASDLQVKEA